MTHRVLILVFPRVQSLDVIGLAEVFADANRQAEARGQPPPYSVEIAAPASGAVETSSGIPLVASLGFDQITGRIDTLALGSGRGAREAVANKSIISSVRRLALRARRVASVCTGAFPLAATGLLDGRRATTHWARCQEFSERFPRVILDPDAIFVADGKFHTSAGGTAGIDLALSLIETDLGRSAALAAARQLVVFLKRPGGQSQFSGHLMADVDGDGRLSGLLQWIVNHLEEDLSVESLACRAAMSPRNFARRFRSEMGVTPAQYVQRLRVDAARRLLTDGDMPTSEIAARCGFRAQETMRLAFQRHLRVAPQQFRHRFRPAMSRLAEVALSHHN